VKVVLHNIVLVIHKCDDDGQCVGCEWK